MRRRMLLSQARLPAEYQEVEWIGATGTDDVYLDTGIVPTLTTKMRTVIMPTKIERGGYFGARGYLDGVDHRFCNVTFSSGTKWGMAFSVNTWPTNRIDCVLNEIYDFTVENGKWSCNGVEYTETVLSSFNFSISIKLFSQYTGLSPTSGCRIYLNQIWENGVLVQELIPCYRKSDNEVGMYDLVGGQFYTNQVTGRFSCGMPVGTDNLFNPCWLLEANGWSKDADGYYYGLASELNGKKFLTLENNKSYRLTFDGYSSVAGNARFILYSGSTLKKNFPFINSLTPSQYTDTCTLSTGDLDLKFGYGAYCTVYLKNIELKEI